MSFAIYQDWSKYNENMINHGRYAIENSCEHTGDRGEDSNMLCSGYCDECGYFEDSAIPMMNYIYPLELDCFDDEKILEVVEKTNCTVIENEETGEWFLAICGGGMDLSQDIALAYHILEKWVPFELAMQVCTQKNLSLSGKNWERMRDAVVASLKKDRDNAEFRIKQWQGVK